jgi:hypothetical protein
MGRPALDPKEVRVTLTQFRVHPKTLEKLKAFRRPKESLGRLLDRLVDRLL